VICVVVGVGAHPSKLSIIRTGIQILTPGRGRTVRFMVISFRKITDIP
jgi:hypothetical protein